MASDKINFYYCCLCVTLFNIEITYVQFQFTLIKIFQCYSYCLTPQIYGGIMCI